MSFNEVTMSFNEVNFMVPAIASHPVNLLSPPILKPSTDQLRWREDINIWTETGRTAAEAGDTMSTGATTTLGLSLYCSLEESKK